MSAGRRAGDRRLARHRSRHRRSELARRGATVIGTATSEAGAQGITQWLSDGGFKGRGLVLNVAEPESVEALLKDIEAKEGAPTILVNNAGITRDNLLLRMKPEEWDEIVNTNLGSVFRLSKGVLRGMMKARRGPHHQHRLGRRRHGQRRPDELCGGQGRHHRLFSKSLAREVGSRSITVNVVAPGFIATDMTAQVAGRAAAATRRSRSRWAGSARRRTSPRRWPFLRRRRPATSPAKRCTSMAACT